VARHVEWPAAAAAATAAAADTALGNLMIKINYY